MVGHGVERAGCLSVDVVECSEAVANSGRSSGNPRKKRSRSPSRCCKKEHHKVRAPPKALAKDTKSSATMGESTRWWDEEQDWSREMELLFWREWGIEVEKR